MNQGMKITDISQSRHIQQRLKELDVDNNGKLTTSEVSTNSGFMRCDSTTTGMWTSEDHRFVEHALVRKNLVRFRTSAVCNPESKVNSHLAVPGNPDIGHVFYIKQRHQVEKTAAQGHSVIDQFASNQALAIQNTTAAYQFDMLKQMFALGITDVFSEGMPITETPASIALTPSVNAKVRKLFPQGALGDRPNPEQIAELRKYGAAWVYTIVRGDVTLHHTEDPANGRRIESIREKKRLGIALTAEEQHFVMHGREQYTTARMMEFLEQNPGAKVMLSFGRAHDFAQHFRTQTDGQGEPAAPRVTEVMFPRALQESNAAIEHTERGTKRSQ